MINTRRLLPLVVAASLFGCSGPGARKAAGPVAHPGLMALSPVTPLLFEPLLCPLHAVAAGHDRPDYDAQDVACVVGWMQEAQDYLARGGKPTKYTNQRQFEEYRHLERVRVEALSKWLDKAVWEPRQSPPKAAAAAPAPISATASSAQHFLSGLVLFQKGDFLKAREDWMTAKQLDPSNKDALDGLERLKSYIPADAGIPNP